MALGGLNVPKRNELLNEWMACAKRILDGMNVQLNNMCLDLGIRVETMTFESLYCLCHVVYTHKLPFLKVMSIWSTFYVMMFGKTLEMQSFVSQTTVYNNLMSFHYIDQALESKQIEPSIKH